MDLTNAQIKRSMALERGKWNLFKEMASDYSFSLQESAFIMLHIQGSVSVLVSMLNRLYGWKLQRYVRGDSDQCELLAKQFGGDGLQACPCFYYRDRITHQFYLLLSNASHNINGAQRACQYDTILIVQGEDAFKEQRRIFGDLTDKASRAVAEGDVMSALHEQLRHLICNKIVLKGDYFDFSRTDEAQTMQDESDWDELEIRCYNKETKKPVKQNAGYAKPGFKADYQKEKQAQVVEIAVPQLGLFDDVATVSVRQSSVVSGGQDIRSSLMDDIPANIVDMARYRQLLALQDMSKNILKTLCEDMCN